MSQMVQSLIAKHFGNRRGELLVGGVPVSALAEQYGTPCFLYDRAIFDDQLDQLRHALPGRFQIYYSMKANPSAFVVRHFLSRGCGLEVASAGEFQAGLDAGCRPEGMLFAGPGKTDAELEFVIAHGIGDIHLESLTEAKRIASIGNRRGGRVPVAIRVNPAGEAEGGAMRMGGRPAPFGVDEEDLDNVLNFVLSDRSLQFRGIHIFAGTQILDASVLVSQYRHGLDIARRVVRRLGSPMERLDFGGGLGIPYFPHEQSLDLEKVRGGLLELCAEIERDPSFTGTEFLVEPGRFLAGKAAYT